MNVIILRWKSLLTGIVRIYDLQIGHPHPLVWWFIIYNFSKTSATGLTAISNRWFLLQMITRITDINNGLLWLMEQKIYDKNNVVHYYEWIHCYCSSIFFRSILENRMLFWIDIIGYRSPQVLQVLQHYYEYHWQLVQVFLLLFGSIRPYIRIRSSLSSPTLRKLHVIWLPLFGFQQILWWWDGYKLYHQALTQLSLISVLTYSRG